MPKGSGKDEEKGASYSQNGSVVCPECGFDNASVSVICGECHAPLVGIVTGRGEYRRRGQSRGSRRSSDDARRIARGKHPSILAKTLFGKREPSSSPSEVGALEGDSAPAEGRSELGDSHLDEEERVKTQSNTASILSPLKRHRSRTEHRAHPKRAAVYKKRFLLNRKTEDTGREAVLWEGKLSWSQRIRQWVPDRFVLPLCRAREKLGIQGIVAIGVAMVVIGLVVAGLSMRPKSTRDAAEKIGFSFEVSDRWRDVRSSTEWPSYFVVTSKILSWGAEPSLVFVKDSTRLAILSKAVATDTSSPQVAADDAQELALVYSLSNDTRLQGRSEVEVFGSKGVIFVAERSMAGEYFNEAVAVVPLNNRVVYVVYAAPQDQWDSERREVEGILRSAQPISR